MWWSVLLRAGGKRRVRCACISPDMVELHCCQRSRTRVGDSHRNHMGKADDANSFPLGPEAMSTGRFVVWPPPTFYSGSVNGKSRVNSQEAVPVTRKSVSPDPLSS